MKKTFLLIAVLFISITAFAQKDKEVKLNKETNLFEAKYYHENGTVSQEGTFNLKGKLHGEWVSYNEDGEKISTGSYKNGIKTGKWLFLANDTLKEVVYDNNAIASVADSKNTSGIVDRN